MSVDSFKFLPRIIAFYYQNSERKPDLPIPWTPLKKPLSNCNFSLITSGGLYHRTNDCPFDIEREKREPTWGDPTFRKLPSNIQQDEIGVSHLHINTADILEDFNILLPLKHFISLRIQKRIGGISKHVYSLMGYQGFPPDTTAWEKIYCPKIAEELRAENVDCVLLTPA